MKKFDNFTRALKNLESSRDYEPPFEPTIQAGIVSLFQICFEQAWKTMKALLEYHGLNTEQVASPRKIIKLAYQSRMISDQDGWLGLLDTRNELAHTYSEADSLEVIEKIRGVYIGLFQDLRDELAANWLPEE